MAGLQFQDPASLSLRGDDDNDDSDDGDSDDDDCDDYGDDDYLNDYHSYYIYPFIHYSLGIISSFHE